MSRGSKLRNHCVLRGTKNTGTLRKIQRKEHKDIVKLPSNDSHFIFLKEQIIVIRTSDFTGISSILDLPG